MEYLLLLLTVLVVNVLPAFAPPTWTVLVFFFVKYNMYVPSVVMIGVIAATIGRAILSEYIKWFSVKIFNDKEINNLKFLGEKIGHTPAVNITFSFLYSLTPLSTTALFVAAGVAHVKTSYVLTGFFLGRLVSYTVLVLSTSLIANNIEGLFEGRITWENALSALSGLSVFFFFIFIDWRQLLENKKVRFVFRIWKWNK